MKCIRCNKDLKYIGRGRPPKYCESCAYDVKSEKTLEIIRKKRFFINRLGTSDFSSHFSGDFDKELEDIKKEKKRLGLY